MNPNVTSITKPSPAAAIDAVREARAHLAKALSVAVDAQGYDVETVDLDHALEDFDAALSAAFTAPEDTFEEDRADWLNDVARDEAMEAA